MKRKTLSLNKQDENLLSIEVRLFYLFFEASLNVIKQSLKAWANLFT